MSRLAVVAAVFILVSAALAQRVVPVPMPWAAAPNLYVKLYNSAMTEMGLGLMQVDFATSRMQYYFATSPLSSTMTAVTIGWRNSAMTLSLSPDGYGSYSGLSQAWLNAMLMKQTYLTVSTVNNPTGEIMGNITTVSVAQTVNGTYAAVALPVFETVWDNFAGVAAYGVSLVEQLDSTGTNFVYSAYYMDGTVPTSEIHYHQAALGNDANKFCTLTNTEYFGTYSANCALSGTPPTVAAGWAPGNVYINFHGAGGPALFRGQMLPMSASVGPKSAHFATTFAASSSAGMVMMSWDAMMSTISWTVWHNFTAATTITLNAAGTVVTLCDNAGAVNCQMMPVSGTSSALSTMAAADLFNGMADFSVLDGVSVLVQKQVPYATNYGDGTQRKTFVTLLSSDQEVPTPAQIPFVYTPAVGAAYVSLLNVSGMAMLEYSVWFNAPTAYIVHLHFDSTNGVYGSNAGGPLVLHTGSLVQNAVGMYDVTTMSQFSSSVNVLDGRAYFNIHNATTYPLIRGQTLPVSFAQPAYDSHYAKLDASQEVPAVSSTATGLGTIAYDKNTRTFRFALAWRDLTSTVTAIHIHAGAAGTNGAVLFNLNSGTLSANTYGFTGHVGPLTIAEAATLLSSNTYFNVHTTNNAGGEIRGQIMYNPFVSVTTAFANQEFPSDSLTVNSANFSIGLLEFPALGSVKFGPVTIQSTFSDAMVREIHLHNGGLAGASVGASLLCTFTASPAPNPCSATFKAANYSVFPAGGPATVNQVAVTSRVALTYLNIHSYQHTKGEVRGQFSVPVATVAPVATLTNVSYGFPLTASQMVPPVAPGTTAGMAVLSIDTTSGVMMYSIWHNAGAVAVTLGNGAPGAAGVTVATLAGTSGQITLSSADLAALGTRQLFIQVGSVLRGQINATIYSHSTFMANGAQEVPVANTPGTGAAIAYVNSNNNLVWMVFHNLGYDISKVHFHSGALGTAGPVVVDVGAQLGASAIMSPSIGVSTTTLTAQQIADFNAGNFYLNLHSYSYPNGEARGQLTGNMLTAVGAPAPPVATTGPTTAPAAADGAGSVVIALLILGFLLILIIIIVIAVCVCCACKAASSGGKKGGSTAMQPVGGSLMNV